MPVGGVPRCSGGADDWLRTHPRCELLREDIERAAKQVLKLGVCRTQGQLDALTSFVFNLGIGQLRKSTLLRVIKRQGSDEEIRREFMRWVYAGGKKMPGLERRRSWEAERFLSPSK